MFAIVTRSLILAAALAFVLVATGPPGMALAAAPATGESGIVFSYRAPDAQAVFLAGDFNNWNAQDLPMTRLDSGDWTLTVPLTQGTYEYKFIADGNWVEDPDNPEKKSDPFGGSNSVVTVTSDNSVAAGAAAVTPPTPTEAPSSTPVSGDHDVGRPKAVDGGILFTYRDPGAGAVNLAGSFNGWNATDLELTGDDQGNWAIVHEMGEGEHEYKFVVDGNWVADPENPDTKSDPYGGSNSLVVVGADGQLVAVATVAEDDSRKPSSTLNAKLYLGGRYLTRFEFVKNSLVDYGEEFGDQPAFDPRYRLQRPTQSVDLNFEAEVSDMAQTYMRIRLDSDQNIIQNNIAGFLDEANIVIHPQSFNLKAFWNQEVYTSSDLLTLGGNIDLEGTIFHDHLDLGKGSAGILFLADPIGIDTELFFANVHNQEYFGDPENFDNTGQDKIGVRLSKEIGPVEIGTPVWMERTQTWWDFATLVSLPSTGIPILDEHRAKTGDKSEWYETDSHNYNFGLDLRVDPGRRFMIGAQGNYVSLKQKFVTGNRAGQNESNGQLDLPFLERDRRMILGQVDFNPSDDMSFSLKHIVTDMRGAHADQRLMKYVFLHQDVANKRVSFNIEDSPASTEADSTDFTWDWHQDSFDLGVWIRRVSRDLDYGPSGLTVPEDSTLTAHKEEVFKASVFAGLGKPEDFLGHGEIEFAFATADAGVAAMKADSYELIFRFDRDLTRNTGLIADLRFIKYNFEGNDAQGNLMSQAPDYFAPFAGFRYSPIKKLELVLAYGVDPLEYSIDYQGRHLGRWMYRQNYLFDFPEATLLDAENFLAKARVVTLRAQLLF